MPWAEPIVRRAAWVLILAITVAFLTLARTVVVPIALAILLAFLLSPIVNRLEQRIHSRIVAVIFTCAVAGALVAGAGFLIGSQMYDFAGKLPGYQRVILTKIHAVRESGQGVLGQAMHTVSEIQHDVAGTTQPAATQAPMPVIVVGSGEGSSVLSSALGIIGPVGEMLATFGVVVLLVVMLLLYGPDLRDRVIVLAGTQQISVTTQALEEASKRISQYLLYQACINTAFGVAIGVGLFMIGVPNAALLGFIAGVLRFIPLIGPWLGAALPILLSFAVSEDWRPLLYVMALFAVTELVVNLIVEPWLYGVSTGISGVAVIGAILFWTWIWGSVGLVLAVPMTVCLVVLGKYVEPLRIFYIILGDEPVLAGDRRLYHRIIGGDVTEAELMVRNGVAEVGEARVCDELLLPVLQTARSDFDRGLLSEKRFALVNETVAAISDDMEMQRDKVPGTLACMGVEASDQATAQIVCNALSRVVEEPIALLGQTMLSDLSQHVETGGVGVLVIVTTTAESLARGRLLTKALFRKVPQVKLVLVDLAQVSSGYSATDKTSSLNVFKSIVAVADRLRQLKLERVNVAAATDVAPPAAEARGVVAAV